MRISAWTGLAKNSTTTRKFPIFVDGKDAVLGTLTPADMAAAYTPASVTLGAGATALSASGRSGILLTGDAGGNSITSITGGVSGQTLAIVFQDALVNISTAAAKLEIAERFYAKQYDTLFLYYDGTNWEEIGRIHNSGAPTAITLGVGVAAIDVTSVPAVGHVKKIKLTGDAGANTITSITGLTNGETLEIVFIDALVTITTTAAKLLGNVSYVSAAHDTLTISYDGTTFREVSRQQQTGLNGVLGAQTARAATVTTLQATGAITPTGGVAAAGGFSVAPRLCHTGGMPARVSTDGTELDIVVTELYVAEVFIDANCTVTGLAVFWGALTNGNAKVMLFDSAGNRVAISASTDVSAFTGDSYGTRIAFSAPYAAKGPATYFVGVICDDNTNDINTHTLGNFGAGKITGLVYATEAGYATITPPTTFTTGLGPIATLY